MYLKMKAYNFETRKRAVLMFNNGKNLSKILQYVGCCIRTLFYWLASYDGTDNSLKLNYHAPYNNNRKMSVYETDLIISCLMPDISVIELYSILRRKGFNRSYQTLINFLEKNGYKNKLKPNTLTRIIYPYTHPTIPYIKWQMDVKEVPKECIQYPANNFRWYQYTIIDECTNRRFIYHYNEHSGYSTFDFIPRAIEYLGHSPYILQSDNGSEFRNLDWGKNATDKLHIATELCNSLKVKQVFVRPATPKHNGKVERSQREDQVNFYDNLKFSTEQELHIKSAIWLERYNDRLSSALTPMNCQSPRNSLNWLTPNQKQTECVKFMFELKKQSPRKFIKYVHHQIRKVCNHKKKIDYLDKLKSYRKRYIIEHSIIT
jgi:transposase InsO family protein